MKNMAFALKAIRKKLELRQVDLAEQLDITVIYLSNLENGHKSPSGGLIDRYRELSGIDPYVLEWSENGDVSQLPAPIQQAAMRLKEAWGLMLNTNTL